MQAFPILKTLALLGVTLTAGLAMGLAGTFLYLNPQIPSAASYREIRLQTPLRVFASDGSFLAEFGERRRIPVSIDAMPELFRRAVLDTEDKRFYSHGGIDYITLMRATLRLLTNPDQIGPGASTITMQVARNVSFSLEQTFIRKFKEMLLAVKIENELSKDEILELYLNLIPFGKRAYGAEAAALTYYGKSLPELTVAQWAMLAGIPQAPSIGNPINGPERALRRRNLVLRNMLDQGSIDQQSYSAAVAAPITASVHERITELDAPWAAEWARQQTVELYGPGAYEDGLEVYTTVDAVAQRAAGEAMRAGLEAYDRRHGYRGPERTLSAPEGPLDDETLARWRATLAETPILGEQLPALVTDVDAEGFDALLASGERVRVPLEAMRWARPFLSVNSMGARPDAPAKVVTRGHLVRLHETEDGWELGQIPDVGGALVALDPDDGAVRALVGGYDFRRLQFNHALQAARQPGSSFKPFVYTSALDAGRTPATIYLDAPLVFSDDNLESLYRPRNDSGNFRGPTRLRQALYQSINLVSMRVLLDVGAGNVIDHVGRFGFDTRTFPRNLQLAIGGGTMALTPLDMARGFAVFANGGFRVDPYLLTRIERGGSEVLYRANPLVACDANCERDRRVARAGIASIADGPGAAPIATADVGSSAGAGTGAQASAEADSAAIAEANADSSATDETLQIAPHVLDERTAYLMHSMLGDVIRYGTGRRARVLERDDLGGKTGTTNEADTWFSGYQRELAATVWVGFSDNRPVGDNEFGSTTALPIWIDLMRSALAGVPEHVPEQPPGIVRVRIDPETGLLASPGDPDAIFELFREENVPGAAQGAPRTEEASPESIF